MEQTTEEYRNEIIKLLNEIDSNKIMRYIYIIINDIVKEKK
jgi:hypothetical protein